MAIFGAAITNGYNGPAQSAPDTRTVRMDVFEDTSPTLLRRVTDLGAYINTDDVLSVVLHVFDLSGTDPKKATHVLPIGVEECLFKTLQTDSAWDLDALGYNFRHKIWQEMLPIGGRIYRCEYTILVLSTDVTITTRSIPLVWELHTIARSGS